MTRSIPDPFRGVRRTSTWSSTKKNVSHLVRKMTDSTSVTKTRNHFKEFSAVLSPWTEEIVYVVISVLLMMTLVIILEIYDGHPLTDWQGAISMGNLSVNISLNFIVAVLGTISKASVAVAVEAGLVQTKWIWFSQRKRPLLDYKRFDNASRGPLGSARLLFTTRIKDFATLGALVVIIGLLFDPFLQLLVSYEGMVGNVSHLNASIARSAYYNIGAEDPSGNYWGDSYNNTFQIQIVDSPVDLVDAISESMSNPNASANYMPTYSCPTVNCTWPAFTSLAVCSRCTNVSSHIAANQVANTTFKNDNGLTFSSPSIRYSVHIDPSKDSPSPDTIEGLYLAQFPFPMLENPLGRTSDFGNYSARIFTTYSTAHPNETFTFKNSNTLLTSVLSLYASPSYIEGESSWESTTMNAMECGLSLCTNVYSSAVINGTLVESIEGTASSRVADSYSLIPGWSDNSTIGQSVITNLSDPALGNGSSTAAFQPYFIPRTDMSLSAPPGMPGTYNITQAALDSLISILLLQSAGVVSTPNATIPASLPSNFSTTSSDLLGSDAVTKLLMLESVVTRSAGGSFGGSDNIVGLFNSWFGSPGSSTPTGPLSLAPYYANLASVATAVLRNSAPPADFAPGAVQQWAVYIQVRWPVVALPALFVLFAVVFLISCIWRSARAGIRPWKEDPLPILIAGLGGEERVKAKAGLDALGWDEKAVEKLCRDMLVRLGEPGRPELVV